MASESIFRGVLTRERRSVTEPKVPPLVHSGSFAFVQTTGNRNAPEALVLEIFREIFFSRVSQDGKERQLSPDSGDFEKAEKAVLFVARGRLKLTKQTRGEGFYAPVFPEQARGGWFRKGSDRALRNHFLQGALAHAMTRCDQQEKKANAEIIVDALIGRRRAMNSTDVSGKEFLSAVVAGVSVDPRHGLQSREDAVQSLVNALSVSTDLEMSLGEPDIFASRIKDDFVALCAIEGSVPRLLWLELLKGFLRVAIPAWVLGRMKVAVLLRDWCCAAVERGKVAGQAEISADISNRWRALFHPTRTGTNELAMHVERYMKARVELSILLYLLEHHKAPELSNHLLAIDGAGSRLILVRELLDQFASLRIERRDDWASRSIRTDLVREAESFSAWTNPLKKGQGKNIDEFLRVLRRFVPKDEDLGYLADKTQAEAVIFPGPALIRLFLMLSSIEKRKRPSGGGKLVLADLEDHFRSYGMEFSSSAGARPRLISELSRMGLLKGSPDAGEYTELLVPINFELALLSYPRNPAWTGAL